ncbi:hypothetical protein GFY24_40365 [Nocardia sp. SYP-A9097]|nr:hypothetical protein [Nocardia sp. SYP-A9097]
MATITFDEVLVRYRADHPVTRAHEGNSNQDGAENLLRAQKLSGTWSRVRLDRSEVLAVVLPWHLSEGGGQPLVPRTGLTVGQAAERIRSGGAEMARANPVCSAKLEWLSAAPMTPVYVSTRPVAHSDYADLAVDTGLIHVDGLHRMIAWELSGRLDAGAEAYLAGALPVSPGPGTASHSASP